MSPVAAGLDILLALLLVSALALGLQLNRRLKALRDGQAGFAAAVIELNQAAARAEAGLNALRTASETAHDELLTSIETARSMVTRLDRASADAQRAADALPASRATERRAPDVRVAEPRHAAPSSALAAIAAMVDARIPDPILPERAEAEPAARPIPRRASRGAFDADLFEAAPERKPLDLGDFPSLRPARGR